MFPQGVSRGYIRFQETNRDGTGSPEKQRGPQFATIASVAGRNDFFCARQIMKEGVTLVYLPYV